ncbi:hypothetical protein [Nitrosopumilus sp.]|uniref:hypothetical protein n=1 Tax=Nitrosopumilus sp. TaxID=2024843 RepID=UPI0029315751|nr:hypothetical protein [Nitrosopumilus sp.]
MINFKKIRRLFPAKVKTAVERGWTVEEIRKMLLVANDTRSQAIINFENVLEDDWNIQWIKDKTPQGD